MTTKKSNLFQQTGGLALLFSVCLMISGQALGADNSPEINSGQPTKLQNLSNRASELAMQSMGLLGINYKWGGNTPKEGLDCSGLVRYVYKEGWGTELPRSSIEISKFAETIKPKDLQAGDLVFFNTLRRNYSHVGIYLGENKFIHAPSRGGQVRIESMDVRYWKKRFDGARRIRDPEEKTVAAALPLQPVEPISIAP
jgi:cell wall-associated NlpC family hydrolase